MKKLVIDGMPLYTSTEVSSIEYFTPYLIRLPYDISAEYYRLPTVEKTSRQSLSHRYLLPLTEEALLHINMDDVELKVKETSTAIKYELRIGNHTIPHTYSVSDDIIDLEKHYQTNIEMGIFPSILSSDDKSNNYFKVMLITRDNNDADHFRPQEDIKLTFYRHTELCCEVIEEVSPNASFGVLQPCVRSTQGKGGNSCSTKFYELFNTGVPSAIAVCFLLDGKKRTGTLLPQLPVQKSIDHSFTYAVDLGTSYTYIARRDEENNTEPSQLEMQSLMMAPLHRRTGSNQLSLIDQWNNRGLL